MQLAGQTRCFSKSVPQGDGYVIDHKTRFYSSGTLASCMMQLDTCMVIFRGRDGTWKNYEDRPNDLQHGYKSSITSTNLPGIWQADERLTMHN